MLFPPSDISSIAIFRALQLGDLLCSVPAFRALRHAYPSARITLIGMPWMKMLPGRYASYFDEFIWFPGYPGLPEQEVNTARIIAFLSDVNARKFDLALQMQGNGSIVNPMVELFGAKNTAGFYRKEDYYPGKGFLEYPAGVPEIHRHLRLMEHLGITAQGDDLEFPVTIQDQADLAAAQLDLQRKYICVHPGSRGSWRQWPPENFASLATRCQEMGYQIVVTGTADELPIVNSVAEKMQNKPVIAAGRTSMGAMAALLKNSSGLISNCTGVSHMASALKTRSIVISMDGEPERWAPLNTELHKTFDWTRAQDMTAVMRAAEQLFSAAV